MNDIRKEPDPRDPRGQDLTVYPEDTPVEERDTSPPEARTTRGVSGRSLRILFVAVGLIVLLYIIAILSGVVDLGGDALQAGAVM